MTDVAVLFSEDYYRQVLHDFGYTSFDLSRFDFPLAGLESETLNVRYLCHHGAERYLRAAPERRIATTGIGMSGPPHMATVSHVLKMIELLRGGECCQLVLGDLDAYNGKLRPYGEVTELADRYQEFARALGFTGPRALLRSQVGHLPALEAMYLLGRYVEESDFASAEEDNHGYYAALGVVEPRMTFRRALSLALMAGDFVALGQRYDGVLVVLGVDEHRYVRFTQQAVERFDPAVPLRSGFALTAAYTRMVRGFGGHPKFSKSLPGSAIDVNTPEGEIHRLLAGESSVPEESATYQLMCQMPIYDAPALLELHAHCRRQSPRWRREVSRFAEYLADLGSLWPE